LFTIIWNPEIDVPPILRNETPPRRRSDSVASIAGGRRRVRCLLSSARVTQTISGRGTGSKRDELWAGGRLRDFPCSEIKKKHTHPTMLDTIDMIGQTCSFFPMICSRQKVRLHGQSYLNDVTNDDGRCKMTKRDEEKTNQFLFRLAWVRIP